MTGEGVFESYTADALNGHVVGQRVGIGHGNLRLTGIVLAFSTQYRHPGKSGVATFRIEGVDGEIHVPTDTPIDVFR